MAALSTRLTRLLNMTTPIIGAPMAGAAGGALAAAVTRAGGFGFIGAARYDLARFREELAVAQGVPFGAGFLGWALSSNPDARLLLTEALDRDVTAIWIAFGENLKQWVDLIRQHNEQHQKRTIIFNQVGTVEEAKEAASWGIDVLVAQGSESGGHGVAKAPLTRKLLRDVLAVVPESLPVLAAGGIMDGTQVASFIREGASGVVIGTALLACPESEYSDAQKKALLQAKSNDAVRTMALDEVRGTTGWPEGVDGRGLKNAVVRGRDEEGLSVAQVKEIFQEAQKEGGLDGLVVWAGTGVDKVKEGLSAEDIVKHFHEEAVRALATQ